MNNRLSKLRAAMINRRLDAVVVSSVSNITYLTNFSHFSKNEHEAFLLLTNDRQYILTDGRYAEAVKNHMRNQILSLPKYDLIEISSKRTFERAIKNLAKKYKIKQIGFDHRNITVAEHKKLSFIFKTIKHFDIDSLRIIKSNQEILAIQKACKLGDKAFDCVLNKIKQGITEKQLAFEIEFFIKKAGGDISFPPIVAFGKNSSIPHHKASDQRLASSGQFILLDFGVRLNNYCSDMTRTVFFGSATREYKKIYQTVLEAQKKAIEYLVTHLGGSRLKRSENHDSSEVKKPEIKAFEIDKVSRDYIISKGYSNIPHSLGHGVGLEAHEAPRLSPKSKDVLKEGMVFTIEPGIYLPGFGGFRIEDVIVLENSGPRLLTKSPKEIIEIG